MSYKKQTWSDTASSGTPITAARMNHMEDGIKDANDAWDSVSQVRKVSATPVSVTIGQAYVFSASVPTVEGYTPVGVVGITSNHGQSLYILAYDMVSSKLWAQTECRYTQPSITVSWQVLYLRS